MTNELRSVPLVDIRPNEVALRAVNRESESYLGLVESIRQKGFLGAITVRVREDEESGEEYLELIDGLHRFTASKDAGLEEINVNIVDLDTDQVLEAQIMANVHKVETKPVQYSHQLIRILARNPLMTEAELANKLGKSPAWIGQRLGLTKIENEELQKLIDEGKICLSNAYALAKLPVDEQNDFVDRAMTLSPDEFVPAANARAKELRDAKRQGKDAGDVEFQPTVHLQKLADLKTEMASGQIAGVLCDGLSTAEEGFNMAIKWALHMDPQSVEAQRAKDEERKRLKAEQKQKREAEKLKKKAEKAAKAQAEVEEAQKALAESEG
jgi:ParB/RepB/Spo0J family partition protein